MIRRPHPDERFTVRFECETCGWSREVPPEEIVIVAGIPHGENLPDHSCADGAQLIERSGYYAELETRHPIFHVKGTL